MSVLLSVRDLKQHFKMGGGFLRKPYTVYAVDGISFDLKQGETLGLVGESGCGKSTLGRSLLKLFEPTAGQISFEGRDITRLSPGEMRSLRQEMQIVFQDPAESLNGRHTVGQILEEPFIIHGKGNTAQRRGWVLELLDKVGLPKSAVDRYPHEFSGGQRQRIGIARAIALKPRLLVCDEAVSALDVSVQSQIVNLLLTLQREMNLAIIFIAHDLSVVKHISDRIAVMYLGRIVELAEAQQLYLSPRHPYTQALLSAALHHEAVDLGAVRHPPLDPLDQTSVPEQLAEGHLWMSYGGADVFADPQVQARGLKVTPLAQLDVWA